MSVKNSLNRYKPKGLFIVVAAVIVLALVPLVLPAYWIQILTQILIMALFATALNMEMGYAGMMPLGQGMFLGLGAYAFGILVLKVGLPWGTAIVVSLIICIAINAFIGFLCLRGEPMTFGLLHMAFAMLFVNLVARFIPVTGGDAGLSGLKRVSIFTNNFYFYLLVLLVVVICYVVIRIIMYSPFGRVAQSLRENEERLIFLGINTKKYQLVLFILSGFFSGVAGILLAMLNQGIFPAYMSVMLSAEAMMMCLVGGMFSFWGPSLGSAAVIILSDLVSNYTEYWRGILGILMVATVLGFRGGVLRGEMTRTKISATKDIAKISKNANGIKQRE
jgi:branched-chain amino acid transport system permease protein